MALLTENRNRVPLVGTGAPVDGENAAIRGDLLMIETAGNALLYVCVTAGVAESAPAAADGGSVWNALTTA